LAKHRFTHDLRSERCEKKEFVTANSNKSMLILIAGSYRSGTNNDPALLRKTVQDMESYALTDPTGIVLDRR